MNSLISISATLAYVNYFSSVVLMPMINITISIISAVIIIKGRNWFKIELKIFSFNRRQGIKLSKTTVHKFINSFRPTAYRLRIIYSTSKEQSTNFFPIASRLKYWATENSLVYWFHIYPRFECKVSIQLQYSRPLRPKHY